MGKSKAILQSAILLLTIAGQVGLCFAAEPSPAAADHARLLRLLGIESLRPGAHWDPAEPNAANYDETTANELLPTLPDPLIDDAGREVASGAAWWASRRAEIIEHFDREIYGRVPDDVPAIDWTGSEPEPDMLGDIPVVSQRVTGRVDNASYPAVSVEIKVTITTPRQLEGPVPAILQLAFDPEVIAAFRAQLSEEQLRALRGPGPSWREQVVGRGWAAVELVATSIQADDGAGLSAGIIGLTNRGQPRQLDDWGALRAWAWGTSRVLDYLESFVPVDATRVAIHGHSRFGKAALVAMAYDARFAVAFISSSGEGGAKLWRRDFGEQIGNIAGTGEYHWVAGNFLKYAGPRSASDLPVDAHFLVALCAPRPVFIGSGAEGELWIDPKGMFLAAVHAGPVYRLLGARDLGTAEYPEVGDGLLEGELAWRQHDKGHTPGPNWPYFLEFAARHFSR